MSQKTASCWPDADWTDVPLIADDTTRDNISQRYDEHTGHFWHSQILVLSDEHLYMWNMTPGEIRRQNQLPAMSEMKHPFWVDEKSIAHKLPEWPFTHVIASKRTYPTETRIDGPSPPKAIHLANENKPASPSRRHTNASHNTEQNVPIATGKHPVTDDTSTRYCHGSQISVLSKNEVPWFLRTFPQRRLLLIDQYEMFVKADKTLNNLVFKFTGAPVRGRLSAEDERRFWQGMEEQAILWKDTLAYPLQDRPPDKITSHPHRDRRCADAWYYFVPNTDYLETGNTDFRLIDLHLMDANDTLVWRNLIAAFIENDRHEAAGKDNLGKDRIILIRLRYCAKEARERANDRRAALYTTFKTNEERENHLKRLALSETKLHFKRFAAFFMRAIEQRQAMRHAPRLFWTMPENEHAVIQLIYHEIFRETLEGMLNKVVAYDRFLKIEQLFNAPNPKAQQEPRHRLLISQCHMRPPTDEQQRSDNVLGIFHNALMPRRFFSSDVYFIPQCGNGLERHASDAPLYKCRASEI